MSERITPGAERHETSADLEAARTEKLAELQEAFGEKDPAQHAEKRAERAREIIHQQEAKPEPEPEPPSEEKTAPPLHRPLALLDHHLNYTETMASVQKKLSPASRAFSKVIHTPAVEKVSEALEGSLARPSVLVGTTWTALIVGSIFYLTARHYGFYLSGSELLFSFIVGALLGLVLEGAWHVLKRR